MPDTPDPTLTAASNALRDHEVCFHGRDGACRSDITDLLAALLHAHAQTLPLTATRIAHQLATALINPPSTKEDTTQ